MNAAEEEGEVEVETCEVAGKQRIMDQMVKDEEVPQVEVESSSQLLSPVVTLVEIHGVIGVEEELQLLVLKEERLRETKGDRSRSHQEMEMIFMHQKIMKECLRNHIKIFHTRITPLRTREPPKTYKEI